MTSIRTFLSLALEVPPHVRAAFATIFAYYGIEAGFVVQSLIAWLLGAAAETVLSYLRDREHARSLVLMSQLQPMHGEEWETDVGECDTCGDHPDELETSATE